MEILYFAWVRDRIGRDGESVEPPVRVQTVDDLVAWLSEQSPAHADALSDRGRLRAAVDQRFAGPQDSVVGAREVALFPPVTGG